MTISADIIDTIHALLKAAPAGINTSDILRSLRNRGIRISYIELEDWLHDAESVSGLKIMDLGCRMILTLIIFPVEEFFLN